MMSKIEDQLWAQAKIAYDLAYAPYSKFSVGAAILADNGQIYMGCNVENAAYPQGSCAESNAIGAMIAGGGKRINTILVVGQSEVPVFPCGGCRQRLSEFCGSDSKIIIATPEKIQMEVKFAALFPFSFDASAL